MPTSVPGRADPRPDRAAERGFTLPAGRYAERGFTLVELMVVVVVIGLLSAAAVLAIPDPRGRVAEEAGRFALRARAAREAAIVTASPVSLWVTAGGYGFERRVGGAWAPMTEKPLRLERWRDGTRAELPATDARVRVVFDATGLADRPLDLRLARDRAASAVRIEANGDIRVDAL